MNARAQAQDTLALPHNLEAEQAVLGALLLNNETFWTLADTLRAHHFFEPLHQRIYERLAGLIQAEKMASPLTVYVAMAEDAALKDVGGQGYLASLAAAAYAVMRPKDYADLVRDLALRRAVIAASDELRLRAFDMSGTNIENLVADMQRRLDRLSDLSSDTHGPDTIGEFANVAMGLVREASEASRLPGTSYGIGHLNGITGGMFPGDLILCAGRPGMGKTALAANVAEAACGQGKAVIFVSLEMQGAQVSLRMMSQLSYDSAMRFTYEAARRGKLNEMEWRSLEESRGLLQSYPLRVEQRRGLSAADIKVACRRRARALEKAGYPLGLVIVDHLGLVRPEGQPRGNRAVELGDITSALRTLAGDMGAPLLLLAQLNREVEKRESRRPYLADLRDSGRVEEDADIVLLLYRPEYYALKERPDPRADAVAYAEWANKFEPVKGLFEIQIAKNRHGPEDMVRAWCDLAFNVVRDAA